MSTVYLFGIISLRLTREWIENRLFILQKVRKNLLLPLQVGLAVDDIKTVQDNAMLSKLAMQVNLTLDVERMLPDFLKKKFILRQQTVWPNKRFGIWTRFLNDANLLTRITKSVLEGEREVSRLI